MPRLKHPVRAIREPFGKAGLTVAVVALVMAMVGGAYAAGKLTSGQKKEVEKIAKKFAGKPGLAGAAGTNGTNGTNGKPGTNGKEGPEGSPWTAGGTLPAGKTETGAWSFIGSSGGGYVYVPLSFPIPLPYTAEPHSEPAISEADAHFVTQSEWEHEGQPEGCKGGTTYKPTAQPGNLCVYQGLHESESGSEVGFVNPGAPTGGAGASGALVLFAGVGDTTVEAREVGTWAVTAP